MKNLLMVSVLILSLEGITNAQEGTTTTTTNTTAVATEPTDNREKFQFGVKAGMSISNVYRSSGNDFQADTKYGLTAGALVAIPIGKYYGFQPEISVSQKGYKGSGRLLETPYEMTRTSLYIDVPIQFVVKPTEFISIMAGPQFSYLAKQRDEFTSSSTSFAQSQEFNNDNLRRNILGFVFGVDVNLKHMVLGARAGYDLQKNNGDGTSSIPRYKNVCFLGTIGYKFYKD